MRYVSLVSTHLKGNPLGESLDGLDVQVQCAEHEGEDAGGGAEQVHGPQEGTVAGGREIVGVGVPGSEGSGRTVRVKH